MVDYRSQNYIVHFLNGVVLTLLGVFCFLYSVYTSDFAELHIRLPFLSFPIFAGEILMLTCIIFFLVKIRYVPIKWNIWHGILVGYLCWGIVKSSQGFIAYGPLAFRNAALFYYPVFALIGYYFYEDGFIPERHKFFLLIFFAGMLLMQKVVLYYVFSYSLLFIIGRFCQGVRAHPGCGRIYLKGMVGSPPHVSWFPPP